MSEETVSVKKGKDLDPGMYNCVVLKTKEKKVYHSSTAQTLQQKGIVKVNSKIEVHIPKTMKE